LRNLFKNNSPHVQTISTELPLNNLASRAARMMTQSFLSVHGSIKLL
jgi:hypothetical protein